MYHLWRLKINFLGRRRCNLNHILLGQAILVRKKSIKPVNLSFTHFKPEQLETSSPVIILHGILGSKTNWRSLARALMLECKKEVYTLDARNHGESPHTEEFNYPVMATDVSHFMQLKQIPTSILIGHSMGGRTVMTLAVTQPKLIEKMIIVDVSPKAMPKQSSIIFTYMDIMKNSLRHLPQNVSLYQARKIVEKYMADYIPEIGLRQFLLTNLYEDKGEIKWRVNIEILQKKFISSIMDFPALSGIYNGKVLFICGELSSYVSPDDHSYIRSLFPKAEFMYVPNAGHWVHSEKPREFLEIVKNFI